MTFFEIRNLHVGRGEETPQFDGIITIRDRDVCRAFNHGRGGANIYHWIAPFNREWAIEKLFPLATKHVIERYADQQFVEHVSGSAALDILVFDYVESARAKPRAAKTRVTQPTLPGHLKVGAIVLFGRPNGEKTKGKVIKINSKSVIVEAIEKRGRFAEWRVSPSLLTVIG